MTMNSSSADFVPEPDLYPLYPATAHIAVQLSSHSGLNPDQKSRLVWHCLTRACVFGELSVLQYVFSDPQAHPFIDLAMQDDDGVGLVSLTIQGFGAESERDVEREECVRLLIAQGADLSADKDGWTPLHYAALLSPPTLVSHLMTHGCSPFDVTRRKLTPLDIVSAHSMIPGRADVALLVEEAMRGEGWTGGRLEEKRRILDERMKRKGKQQSVREDVGKALGIHPRWWSHHSDEFNFSDDTSDSELEEEEDESIYTPPLDYTNMLVFSPPSLPAIFESLITNYPPSFRNSQPANLLYMLARFACLTCDHNWLEDFMLGATEAIEDNFFNRPEDITVLVFWLYNTTIWLHLMQCDKSISDVCEMLGSFELIEETINSVFVFIIRLAERKIDELLDSALLDYASLGSEFDSVQFESEQWSFLRPFTGKKKTIPPPTSAHSTIRGPPSPLPLRPPSPSPSVSSFSSIRQSFRARASSSTTTPIHFLFSEDSQILSPSHLTSYLTALHTFLTLSDINPALITQLWSQVMYWTSCEMFNRVLTRKKYICRSRAVQITMNLGVIEEWVGQMGLPRGVQSHFSPVRDLLNWLQCLSSITEFPDLVATIQTMKSINPLQMRRAVRDYKYEVNEGRMTEECIQYLTQLQKDWERHRVKLGVEALRKEMNDRDHEGSVSSSVPNESPEPGNSSILSASSTDALLVQEAIDLLFDQGSEKSNWEPAQPPQVLGELLDSRYMLPLIFPSDPRMLSARPGKIPVYEDDKRSPLPTPDTTRSASRASDGSRGAMAWHSRNRKVREVSSGALKWIDGAVSASRWGRPVPDEEGEDTEHHGRSEEELAVESEDGLRVDTRITPLTRKRSARKTRPSVGGGDTTPVEQK
ncbi:DIL domain-containing protein [Lentinula aciculospora]|uniref:DIL domain-containing protein n=1 Tax=Lentinula aciculospora TaxID=153920 RepID=A0A9W9DTK8_9AGAR|nr:DIL domain-containing protein [Lentinula aciculospora]